MSADAPKSYLPCVFCGSLDLCFFHRPHPGSKDIRFIHCQRCMASAPSVQWNLRAEDFYNRELAGKTIGKKIKYLRRHDGLTQSVLAATLGISTSYLSDIERDNKEANLKVIANLSKNFRRVNMLNFLAAGEES